MRVLRGQTDGSEHVGAKVPVSAWGGAGEPAKTHAHSPSPCRPSPATRSVPPPAGGALRGESPSTMGAAPPYSPSAIAAVARAPRLGL